MSIPLPKYAEIKDKYCISYYGNCNEYLVQLKLLRPKIEETFPGLQVYIACKPEAFYILNKEKNIVYGQFNKEDYAYVRELNCDMKTHPVEELMTESNIEFPIFNTSRNNLGNCMIYTKGNLPTKNMTEKDVAYCVDLADKRGWKHSIDKEITDETWIISVENEKLFEYGATGKYALTLVNKGIGENIFKKLFPVHEILNLVS